MATDLATIISDIEEAITRSLETRGLAVTDFNIADDVTSVRCPAANISLWSGSISEVTRNTYRMNSEFMVTLIVENLRDEKARRKAVYPLVMGVVQILAGQKLYVEREDVLVEVPTKIVKPAGVKKLLDSRTRIAYGVRLNIPFMFSATTVEEAESILEIALQFLWKPGDDNVDFSSVLDVS